MIVNQKQLANMLGITDRRVRQLREEGLFNFAENGRGYCLEKCIPEYIDFKIKAEVGTGTLVIKEKEQAEHERIKKKISKLKLRKLKKELHEATDVEFFLSEMLINFKNRLMSIPSKIAIQMVGEEDINKITEILNYEMLETLEELSEYDPDVINNDNNMDYDDEEPEDEE
ncbi:hypothetical protein C8E03_110110 [Lachnotalea glycerini]|uniref:DNA-packaging protein n=1 Tax=Lachnotalea glycerini TaxID=1763509 RepID=A0A318ENM1_9FIRM|nr:DNA-packaging protein [Lachnotalea glycerini]PXV87349.1 hypothetical protein C8E03_110110 [Lachnotalea glycerini]